MSQTIGLEREQQNSTFQDEFIRGWLVLSAAFVGIGCGVASMTFYTTGVFVLPWQAEFGWSRSAISAYGLVGVIALSVLSPVVGSITDRIGVRNIAAGSLFFYAVGMFANSFMVNSLWVFYGLGFVMSVGAVGSSPVTFTRAVTGWFDKARGLALGLALLGAGVTSILAPILLTKAVEAYGWRVAFQLLAAVIFCAACYVYMFLREGPRTKKSHAGSLADQQHGYTLKQAVRMRVFPRLVIFFFSISLAVSGLIVHFIPLLSDVGVSSTEAARLAAFIGLSVMVGRVLTGALIDHIFAPRVATVLLIMASIGYMAFAFGGASYAVVAAVAIGLSMGAEVDLIGYLVSRYFGLKSYGVLYGILYTVFLLGAGISPVLAGLTFENTGNYTYFIFASTGCLIFAAIISLFLPQFPNLNDT